MRHLRYRNHNHWKLAVPPRKAFSPRRGKTNMGARRHETTSRQGSLGTRQAQHHDLRRERNADRFLIPQPAVQEGLQGRKVLPEWHGYLILYSMTLTVPVSIRTGILAAAYSVGIEPFGFRIHPALPENGRFRTLADTAAQPSSATLPCGSVTDRLSDGSATLSS
jgi:hypothetical protein